MGYLPCEDNECLGLGRGGKGCVDMSVFRAEG